MPHYHNFGWYYFAKYILGLAGMIFLYTGFLKEQSVVCACPAEEREDERGKKRNNEYCPTGDPSNVSAMTEVNAQNQRVAVDAQNQNANAPISRKDLRCLEKTAVNPAKKFRLKSMAERNLHREKSTKVSNSDGKFNIRDRQHHPLCHRTLKRRGAKNVKRIVHEGTSSLSSKSCLEISNDKNPTLSILHEVARANLRVRNSFAEQENLEFEAFVRSIVDQKLLQKFSYSHEKISSSSSISSEIISTTEIGESDDEERQNTSSENDNFQKYRIICPRARFVPPRMCRKHNRESPITSFTSVQTRSGSVYFTASSRGKKRPECKIHGRRFSNGNRDYEFERRRRITEESDESNNEIRDFRSSVDRRKIGERRVTRYKSTMIFTL